MFSMFAESTRTCGGFSIIAATTPASISTAKTMRLRDAASFGLRPMNPARAITGSSTSMRCSFTRCSLSTMFSSGTLKCFFFPSHDYLKRTRHPAREYAILFAGKAFYLTYMLILPVVVLGKSPLLVAAGVRAGPFDHRFDRIAGIPDDAHHRQHLLSRRTAASLTTASITSLRPRPIMRRRTRWWVGSLAGSTTTSSIICALSCATPTMLRSPGL